MPTLPIPMEAIVALVLVLLFFCWTVLWDDRRDAKRIERKLAKAAKEGESEKVGKHV